MKEVPLATIPWNCPVCKSCRLIVSGTYGCSGPRQCIAGGPYKGYISEADVRRTPSLEEDGIV